MLGIIDDRFELVALMDRGEFEAVYYARDRMTDGPVTVRELAPGFFDEPEAFDFFLIEYKHLARLRHRAVIGQRFLKRSADGRVFVVSEYTAGLSLRSFLDLMAADEHICPPAVAVHVVSEVGGALQAAHDLHDEKTGEPAGALHLDVCPPNILLSPDGAVKLKGFEISRARLRRGLGDRPGRLAYISPERIEGGYLDHRSDLFSLGSVFFEMLTGGLPFPGETRAKIRQKIAAGEYDAQSLDQSGIPRDLRHILKRMLALSPDDRIPDSNRFLAEIDRVAVAKDRARPRRELSRLLRYCADTRQLGPPAEESVAEPEEIVTETLYAGREERPTIAGEAKKEPPEPVAPEETDTAPKLEPIEALAGGQTFRKTTPERTERRRRVSPGFLRNAAAGVIVLFLILDLAIGITPFGNLLHRTAIDEPEVRQIVSVPVGASIYINDGYIGRTPREVKSWPEGVTSIRLEHEGYAPAETVLVIERGQSPELPVFVLGRTLVIRSRPPGADVIIDGNQISGTKAAGYALRAADTISIEIRKAGLSAPPPLVLSSAGPLGEVDLERWLIDNEAGKPHMTVTGIFAREIMISSRPRGAEIFLAGDTIARGATHQVLELPLGIYQITLHRPPFLDYTFEIEVAEDSPDRYAPVLSRYVRISAVGADVDAEDIGAIIRWVSQSGRLIKRSEDRLRTPYSVKLEAANHDIMLSRDGYQDTLVVVPAEVNAVTVVMKPQADEPAEPEPEIFGWVRFSVRRSGQPVSGAAVIGYEKDQGYQYELGVTGVEGELQVKVRPGRYDFVALQAGERSRVKGERIKSGRKIKSIKLEFR